MFPRPTRKLSRDLRRSLVLAGLVLALLWLESFPSNSEPLNAPRPIDALSSLMLEDLTWMEVRDLLRQGTTRVIIPTGGIEQNGPYVALNKHDIIVRAVALKAAARAEHTLVAPIVSFVPEGDIVPPSGHMVYPGTLSLTENSFVQLLHDLGSSLITHGFKDIILIGDSGDSQAGLKKAAELLMKERGAEARTRFIPSFYNYVKIYEGLKARGFNIIPESYHEQLPFTLQLLAIKPASARYDQRKKVGSLSVEGTSIANLEEMATLGREIIDQRAEEFARAINDGSGDPPVR